VKLHEAADRFDVPKGAVRRARADLSEGRLQFLKRKRTFARMNDYIDFEDLAVAVDEAAKCAWCCRYYAETLRNFWRTRIVETTASRSYLRYQAAGPVLAVMPGFSVLASA